MQKKFIIVIHLMILLVLASKINAQQVTVNENGEEITDYGNIISTYDPFTDKLTIQSKYIDVLFELTDSVHIEMRASFSGDQECFQDDCQMFRILIFSKDTSIVEFLNLGTEGLLYQIEYPVLYDSDREVLPILPIRTQVGTEYDFNGLYNSSMIVIELGFDQIDKIVNSESIRVRIEGHVIPLHGKIKSYFIDILSILNERRSKYKERKKNKSSAPYELKWEGNTARDPLVQPLPQNTANQEGIISVRFQVKPDGTVGLIIPLKKMDEKLEKEVQKTLRSWKFSKLSSGVPQQAQWGTITFRFVFD